MRDEYLSVQRQRGLGWTHPALVGPPFPGGLEYLFNMVIRHDEKGIARSYVGGWFGELSGARSSNGFGVNPVSYAEIDAWARLTGRHPSFLEVSALRRLDAAYLSIMGRKDG